MTNPCRINGVVYPSQVAASRALGVHPSTIVAALTHGREDFVGPTGKRGKVRQPVTLDGVQYASQYDAAAALGITRSAIGHRLRRAKTTGQR